MIGEGILLLCLGILEKLDMFYEAVENVIARWLYRITRRFRERKLRKATEYVRRNGYMLSVKDRVRVAGKVWYIGEVIQMDSMNGERAEVILIRPHEFLQLRRLENDD